MNSIMPEYDLIDSCGHQHFEVATGDRHLVQGPIVPEGETWYLRRLVAKNNMDPNVYPQDRTTPELSVCVLLPSRPALPGHETPPPTWVLLNGEREVRQFQNVGWEGYLPLRPGSQLGVWCRGAEKGDVLEMNAIFDVEVRSSQGDGGNAVAIVTDVEAIAWFTKAHGIDTTWPHELASEEDDGDVEIIAMTPQGAVSRSPKGWLLEMLDGTEAGTKHLELLKRYLAKKGEEI